MRMRQAITIIFLFLTAMVGVATAFDGATGTPPLAVKDPVTERRFGLTFNDPYRWMENADDPRLYKWRKAEAAYTDARTAGALREELAAEFLKIFSGDYGALAASDVMRFEERRYQRHRFRRQDVSGMSRFGVAAPPSGRYSTVFEPDNTDIQILRVHDNVAGAYLDDILKVKWSTVVWDEGEKSFVYGSSRDGRLGGATFVVRRHVLGTSQLADTDLYESEDSSEEGVLLQDGVRVWLSSWTARGSRLDSLDLTTGVRETVLKTRKGVFSIFQVSDGKCWAVSFLDRDMGEIVMFDTFTRKMTTVVPARELAVDRLAFVGSDLYVTYVKDGANELVWYENGSGAMRRVALPEAGTVDVLDLDSETGRVSIRVSTYVGSPDLYAYDPRTDDVTLVTRGARPDVELEAFPIRYPALEGWTAPVWIVKRKDTQLSNETPMCVYGYGGFFSNLLPYFDPCYLPWLRRGGAMAFVILPGGLEMGLEWYRQGVVPRKKNVFDACARATKKLIDLGWTNSGKVVLLGASNGGLLAAATARYHPDLFRVTAPHVGVLDMGRFGLFTGGSQWSPDYGYRDLADDFQYQMAISPYNSLKAGMRYPSAMVVTADMDDRVVPAHSFKFVARLREKLPEVAALLHVVHGTGHNYRGATIEENVKTCSIVWTFIMTETGMRP